jgi:hypothetical protein
MMGGIPTTITVNHPGMVPGGVVMDHAGVAAPSYVGVVDDGAAMASVAGAAAAAAAGAGTRPTL